MEKYKRPKVLQSWTYRITTACGYLYVTITHDDYEPKEIFLSMGKAGGCIYSLTVIIARLASSALRHGVGVEEVLKQVKNEHCPSEINAVPIKLSCGNAIANAIERFIAAAESRKEENAKKRQEEIGGIQPDVPVQAMEEQAKEGGGAGIPDELPSQSGSET